MSISGGSLADAEPGCAGGNDTRVRKAASSAVFAGVGLAPSKLLSDTHLSNADESMVKAC
jgi:hypothetical protein